MIEYAETNTSTYDMIWFHATGYQICSRPKESGVVSWTPLTELSRKKYREGARVVHWLPPVLTFDAPVSSLAPHAAQYYDRQVYGASYWASIRVGRSFRMTVSTNSSLQVEMRARRGGPFNSEYLPIKSDVFPTLLGIPMCAFEDHLPNIWSEGEDSS